MRKIGGIYGSNGKLDGQPALVHLVHKEHYVENFPSNQAFGLAQHSLSATVHSV
jgi:hypothetical protein